MLCAVGAMMAEVSTADPWPRTLAQTVSWPCQDKEKPDNSAIMQPIAHDLTDAQIEAVAAYVSQLD
jgi:mono/diheme cytochrome c family protein